MGEQELERLVAVATGAEGLERFPTWPLAVAWWEMLARRASRAGQEWWQSYAEGRIGDINVHRGNSGAALTAYRAGMVIRKRLAISDPTNAEWQRDLSISHDRIGDVLRAQGDRAGALASCRAGMVIHERLAVSDPANAEWQRDLFVSLHLIATVLLDDKAFKPELLTIFSRALDQARLLHKRFPEIRERVAYVEAAQDLLNRANIP